MVLVLLVAALAGAAVVLTGGRLPRVRLRAVRLLVAAAVVQVGTSALAPGSGAARMLALVATVVLVGLFVVGNLSVPGTPLVAAGLLLNVGVIAANAAMPVSLDAARQAGLTRTDLGLAEDALREPADAGTRLRLLGDVVPVALPLRPQVVSPGDVLVAAGVGLLLLGAGSTQAPRARQAPRRTERSTVCDSDSTTTGSYS